MKQTGMGIRLVQRKFAQGVPVPASHAAPLPPERRREPPKERKTVYHSRMSARSLLDIVSLQNVHRHKQPMVLLERLRVHDIPTVSSPTLVKKRLTPKTRKNNMCLRPREKSQKILRKKKTKETRKEVNKTPLKKRPLPKRDEISSATDDDTPLLYLRKNAPRRPSVHQSVRSGPERRSRRALGASPEPPARRALRPRLLAAKMKKRLRLLSPYKATKNRSANVLPPPPVVATPAAPKMEGPPEPSPPRSPYRCPSKDYKSVHDVVSAATADNPNLDARCGTCRECTIVAKVLHLKHLVHSEGVNPGAIYDFDTELEEAMCPSLSTLRSRRRNHRAAGEHIYLDILPPDSPQILRILCKTTVDKRTVSSVSVVDREVAANAEHPTLEEHENLLDQLLDCMSRRAHESKQARAEAHKAKARPQKNKKTTSDNSGVNKEASTSKGVHEANQERDRPQAPKRPSTASEPESVLMPPPACPARPRAPPASPARPRAPPEQPPHIKQPSPPQTQTKTEPPDSHAESTASRPPSPGDAPEFQLPVTQATNSDSLMCEVSSIASTVAGRPPQTLVDAPVFRPTVAEFTDPIEFYKKIRPYASKYGLCKVVPPPEFVAPCVLGDNIRFAVIYQYISKLYNRWGPVAREMAAIKVLLRTQKVAFARAPLLNGCEVNLPKLYHAVERHGGLTKVMHRKRWGRVAEDMKLANLPNPESKLDNIYMRYLLPYATLSDKERQDIMAKVEKHWTTTKYKKMLARARNPLHAQKRLLGASDSSSDDGDSDTAGALEEAEDCITQGRVMNLATFRKVAKSFMDAQFPSGRPDTGTVERAYWHAVLLGTEHIVANTASIDSGLEGYGFPKDPKAPCGTHPWNLKMLASNPGNVLRFLGPVLGVTVPTLHLSMLYSTCCWHRDPHGLPWVEYLHTGPAKIWYGIPSSQSYNFRRAVETLCPAYCQNKSIWLASDIAMIPPEILSEHGVALARVEQKPGEFVMVFPEAHSCSITTGFSVSESVYFAPNTWFDMVHKLFQDLRSSCEPTMFSLEQLLLNGAEQVGGTAARILASLLQAELRHRELLESRGVPVVLRTPPEEQQAWSTRGADECEYCRASLYLSKVVGPLWRRTPLCPEHALLLLEKSRVTDSLELQTTYSTAALQARLCRLGGGLWSGVKQLDQEEP